MNLILREHLDPTRAWAEVYQDAPGLPYMGAYVVRMTRDRERVRAFGVWPKVIQGKPGPVRLTIDDAILSAVRIHARRGLLPPSTPPAWSGSALEELAVDD